MKRLRYVALTLAMLHLRFCELEMGQEGMAALWCTDLEPLCVCVCVCVCVHIVKMYVCQCIFSSWHCRRLPNTQRGIDSGEKKALISLALSLSVPTEGSVSPPYINPMPIEIVRCYLKPSPLCALALFVPV